MTFVLTATKVLNILSKTLKDAVSGFFEFYSLREGGGLLKSRYSSTVNAQDEQEDSHYVENALIKISTKFVTP